MLLEPDRFRHTPRTAPRRTHTPEPERSDRSRDDEGTDTDHREERPPRDEA